MNDASAEARRALARLGRSAEKCRRELASVEGALRHAEGGDFPADAFDEAGAHLDAIQRFIDEQGQRLAEKILHAGGLEPGRIRRSGGG